MHHFVHVLAVEPFGVLAVLGQCAGVDVGILLFLASIHHAFHQSRHDVVAHFRTHSVGDTTHLQLHHGAIHVVDERGRITINVQAVFQFLRVTDFVEAEVKDDDESNKCAL